MRINYALCCSEDESADELVGGPVESDVDIDYDAFETEPDEDGKGTE